MNADAIFYLSDEELRLTLSKNTGKNKLSFAILLKYFQLESHYPKHIKFIDPLMVKSIANQLHITPSLINTVAWEGRSTKRFRREIRGFLGYREATLHDVDALKTWLKKEIFPHAVKRPQQIEHAYTYFRQKKIAPFTSRELERHIRSAHHAFEQHLFDSIYKKLTDHSKLQMNHLFIEQSEIQENDNDNQEKAAADDNDGSEITFNDLKKDIPGAKLKHVTHALQKILCLKKLELPHDLFQDFSTKLIVKYYTRVMAERHSSMSEYKEHIRHALFSIFCYFRSQYLTDSLADLFMKLTHALQTKAENFINNKILSEVKCVNGKFDILYKLSSSALANPTGIIQEKIYPEVDKETLNNLVKELYYRGRWYQTQVQAKMHALYSHAHRKMLLTLLDAFSFQTHLNESKPLLEAIRIIKAHRDFSDKYYPNTISIPIENVVPT